MVDYGNVRIVSGEAVQGGEITVAVDVSGGRKSDDNMALVIGSLDRSHCFAARGKDSVSKGDTVSNTITIPDDFSGIVTGAVGLGGNGCNDWKEGDTSPFFAITQLAGVGGVSLFEEENIIIENCDVFEIDPDEMQESSAGVVAAFVVEATVRNDNFIDADVQLGYTIEGGGRSIDPVTQQRRVSTDVPTVIRDEVPFGPDINPHLESFFDGTEYTYEINKGRIDPVS